MGIFDTGSWLLASACALQLCVVCETNGEDWQTYAHDVNHTSTSSASFDPGMLHLSWTAPIGYSSPLIVGDNVIATKNGQGSGGTTTISSFKLSDGSVNWNYTNSFVFPSQAGYGNGFVAISATSQSNFSDDRLYVLDAETGALKYSMAIDAGSSALMPQIHRDTLSGKTTAYVGTSSGAIAVDLGSSSGSALFATPAASVGGQSIPTLLGESLLMAGPGQYYAFNRFTGATNHFHAGDLNGGGGTTIAADPASNRFYVMERYDTTVGNQLTAYSYSSNSDITQLWTTGGNGVSGGASVAIGPNGAVYSIGRGTLTERDPVTGNILRSVAGTFANGVTPLIEGHYLWAYSANDTLAYDLNTMTLIRTLPGSRGNLNSAYDVGGAVDDSHFIVDYGNTTDRHGFDVYVIPEPTMPVSAACVLALLRRKPRS